MRIHFSRNWILNWHFFFNYTILLLYIKCLYILYYSICDMTYWERWHCFVLMPQPVLIVQIIDKMYLLKLWLKILLANECNAKNKLKCGTWSQFYAENLLCYVFNISYNGVLLRLKEWYPLYNPYGKLLFHLQRLPVMAVFGITCQQLWKIVGS